MADEQLSVEISATDRASQVFRDLSRGSDDLLHSISAILTPAKLLGGLIGYEMVSALKGAVDEFAKFATQVRDLSYLSGATFQQTSILVNGMEALGVQVETVERGMSLMSRSIESGSPILEQLGLSARDANGHFKTANQLFLESIDALGGMTDSIERNNLGRQLFGRGWMDLVPILAMGSQKLLEIGSAANKTITPEDYQRVFEFNRAVHELHETMSSLAVSVGRELLPQLTQVFKVVGPVAVDSAHVLLGVFQEVDAALLMLVAGSERLVSIFAWITDAVHLTTGAYEQWSESANTSWGAAATLADKAIANLLLQRDATTQVAEVTKQSTGADKEKSYELEKRLKLEQMLAQLRTQAEAALAEGYEEKYLVTVSQINDQMAKLTGQIQLEQAQHKLSAAAAQQELEAVAALGEALHTKAIKDFLNDRSKYLVMLYEQQQQLLQVWQGYADQRLGIEREITASTLNEQEKQLRGVDDWVRESLAKLHEKLGYTREAEGLEEEIVAEGARQKLQIQKDYQAKLRDLLQNQTDSFEEAYRLQGEAVKVTVKDMLETWRKGYDDEKNERDKVLKDYELYLRARATADASLWEAMQAAAFKTYRELDTFWNNVTDGFATTFKDASRLGSDLFFDVFTGNLNNLGNDFENFGKKILRTLSDILANEVTRQFLSMFLGIGSTPTGGNVPALPAGIGINPTGLIPGGIKTAWDYLKSLGGGGTTPSTPGTTDNPSSWFATNPGLTDIDADWIQNYLNNLDPSMFGNYTDVWGTGLEYGSVAGEQAIGSKAGAPAFGGTAGAPSTASSTGGGGVDPKTILGGVKSAWGLGNNLYNLYNSLTSTTSAAATVGETWQTASYATSGSDLIGSVAPAIGAIYSLYGMGDAIAKGQPDNAAINGVNAMASIMMLLGAGSAGVLAIPGLLYMLGQSLAPSETTQKQADKLAEDVSARWDLYEKSFGTSGQPASVDEILAGIGVQFSAKANPAAFGTADWDTSGLQQEVGTIAWTRTALSQVARWIKAGQPKDGAPDLTTITLFKKLALLHPELLQYDWGSLDTASESWMNTKIAGLYRFVPGQLSEYGDVGRMTMGTDMWAMNNPAWFNQDAYNRYTLGPNVGRAAGGPIRAGSPYLVGEQGPEWVLPTANATVVPNEQSRRLGGGMTINIDLRGAVLMADDIPDKLMREIQQRLALMESRLVKY